MTIKIKRHPLTSSLRNQKIFSGSDIVSNVSNLANKIGMPVKNWHLPLHKYTGPFTELDKRLDENDNPLPGYEPFNQIDEIAMKHDICYRDSDNRKQCDKEMLNRLDKMKTKNLREKIDYAVVKPVIWTKYKLGASLEAEELHKPIRHKFKRRRIFVFNTDDIWSADLKDMHPLSKQNKHYKYLLNVIDLFSKYAYSIPLKSKSSAAITNAFKSLFLTSKRQPRKLWTDQGTEFTNNQFKKFLKDNNIELYHVYNEGKAAVVERFNRTLGEMIQKHLTSRDSKYIDVLQRLLDEYNNKYHSSIKMTPFEASQPENRDQVVNNLYSNIKQVKNPRKLKIGDKVRIYAYKSTFTKGYMPRWTKEIFVIDEIMKTNPITYKIKDLNGEPILGSFYIQELQKTKF